MKNVLVVMSLSTLSAGSRSIGGVDTVCQNLLEELIKRNEKKYNYEIIAFNPFNDLKVEGARTVVSDSISITQYNEKPNYENRFIKIPGLFWQNYVISKVLNRFKAEVIHTHFLSWQILHRKNAKTISTLHSYKKIGRISRSLINNFIFEKIIPIVASRNVENYTTVSHWLKSAVAKDNLKNVSVIYNPIPEIYFTPYLEGLKKVGSNGVIKLVTCGVLAKRKGIHHAILVLDELKKQGVAGYLDIIGGVSEYAYHIELKNMVLNRGLNENVTFHGRLSTKEIKKIYANSDYGLFLSSEETFGLVPLEMLASGLELISTKVGIMDDAKNKFVSLGVKIIDEIDVLEISKYIISGEKSNHKKIQSLLRNEFSAESVVEQYEDIYEKILNKC